MNNVLRLAVVLTIISLLSACGGGGGGATTTTTDTTLDSPMGVALTYPDSFPATSLVVAATSSAAYTVSPLVAGTSYNITISSASAALSFSAQDTSSPSTNICVASTSSGSGTCTITMTGTSAYIAIINSNSTSVSYTLDVTEVTSSSGGTVNVGSTAAPVTLALSQDLPYDSSIGSIGNSYYKVTGLTAGARYFVDITNSTESLGLAAFSDDFVTDAGCDPNYSYGGRCLFVSQGDYATFHVSNSSIFGSNLTLVMTEVSQSSQFDGNWNSPSVLDATSADFAHLGIVDGYSSYYKLTGLTVGHTYTVELNSKADDTHLAFVDGLTGVPIYWSCATDTRANYPVIDDELCTFTATESEVYVSVARATEDSTDSRFILKLMDDPESEGTSTIPVDLAYASSIHYVGTVGNSVNSYYHVSGLTPGSSYKVSLTGDASSTYNTLTVYDGDYTFTTPVSCDSSDTLFCIITVSGTDLYFTVDPSNVLEGTDFVVNVTSVPVDDADTNLVATDMPYAGQRSSYILDYTVMGYTPNADYVISIADVTSPVDFSTSDGSLSSFSWAFDTTSYNARAVQASPEGGIRFLIGSPYNVSDTTTNFTVNVRQAGELSSDYQDTGNAAAIPDNSPTGLSRAITVSGSAVTSISEITVEVNVEHNWTSDLSLYLIAPDGTSITLFDHTGLYEMMNTRFNDYAETKIDMSFDERYKRSFRPMMPLHLMNGMDANGTWTLKVVDDLNTNVSSAMNGYYHSWGISFK